MIKQILLTTVSFLFACHTLISQTVSLHAYLGVNVQGIAIDASGNTYVTGNNMVLKVSPAAVTTTLAGSTTPGSADGLGTAASFSNPIGICVNASGDIYVADNGNFKIRKITPSGQVTTFAGSGTAGTVNATGASASFQNPTGICLAPNGDLFVSDQMNFSLPFPWTPKIRQINSSQVVSDFCVTNGNCHGVTVISNSLFIAQPIASPGGHSIYYISTATPGNTVNLLAGTGSSGIVNGPCLSAQFNGPMGIAGNAAGDIYVADNGNHRIRLISSGSVTTLAGNGGIACVDGLASTANFWGPNAIAVSGNGDIYVGDYYCQSIRKITAVPSNIKTQIGNEGDFSFFPNPANDVFYIKNINKITESITIYDITGNAVMFIEKPDSEISIKHLKSGLYIVKVLANSSTSTFRLIKN